MHYVWSTDVSVVATTDEGGEVLVGQEFWSRLSDVVELEPKLWVPVRLLEGRICKEMKTNLVCIREEAERVQRLQGGAVTEANRAI
uniref:Uncharacterized protein n=1 Tax=Aegilops tauschii subsp. strangulata TaxID=200361 RepID=A0A453GW23_AEGTS